MAYANDYHNPFIIWIKPITYPGVKPGMYSITSIGDIINNYTGKVLSQAVSYAQGGYRSIGLQMENGSIKTFPVHILVAYEYVPKTEEDIALGRNVVHHKSMYTDDNYKDNLEWLTHEENIQDAAKRYADGAANEAASKMRKKSLENKKNNPWGKTVTRGSANGMATHTEEEIHEICRLLDTGMKPMDVAVAVGMPRTDNSYFFVRSILVGKRWKHISCQYNFIKDK